MKKQIAAISSLLMMSSLAFWGCHELTENQRKAIDEFMKVPIIHRDCFNLCKQAATFMELKGVPFHTPSCVQECRDLCSPPKDWAELGTPQDYERKCVGWSLVGGNGGIVRDSVTEGALGANTGGGLTVDDSSGSDPGPHGDL